MRLRPQTIVMHKGRRGVTCTDLMSCCTDDETPVIFDGMSSFVGTKTTELNIIGPENAIADFTKCGGGTDQCCIYLVVGASGFTCERYSDMRWHFVFNKYKMNAQRDPVEPFPGCQLQ